MPDKITIKLIDGERLLQAGRQKIDATFLDFASSKACAFCGSAFFRDKRCTWKHWDRAKFCSRRCTSSHNVVRADAGRLSVADAFARWFERSDGCWLWAGALDRDGYGIFTYRGKTFRAARVALDLAGRAPANDQYACHHCDNPQCVRPDHLYAGSHADNEDDKRKRGRLKRGEEIHCAKLTEADVRAIRASNDDDRTLAERLMVSRSNISAIRSGKTWRHVR